MKTPLPAVAALAFALTGCYTQLYTRGYAERAVEPEEAYARGDSALGDSLAAAPADTLYRPGTVIVNNYYHENPYYRGYALDAWDYPTVSLGFYSGRYRDYCGAYWWHDPEYGRPYHRRYYEGGSVIGGGNPGPYRSDKRIFAPAPSQPSLRKGRRAEPAPAQPAPAPKVEADPAPAPPPADSQPDSKASAPASSSEEHPNLHKGRRR